MESMLPLISCICITSKRIILLKKAINYFKSQDYPNKELVISYPKQDKLTRYTINKILEMEDLKIIKIERCDDRTLGEARNQAINRANGDYMCNWDDDDWYHSSRLSYQFHSMINSKKNYKASVLNQLLLYDQTTKKGYLSFLYTWENTLLCKKEIFIKNTYSNKDRGEDSSIVDFLDAENFLCHISDLPFLYIYIYHSGNTWNYTHFKSFFKKSQLLEDELTQKIRQLIE